MGWEQIIIIVVCGSLSAIVLLWLGAELASWWRNRR